MEAIRKRRSIRKYVNREISKEKVEYLLKMGMQAPSAHNKRPWQFLVINDPKALKGIADMHPYAKMIEQAPIAILVCGDMKKAEKTLDFWVQDCAAVAENMLIGATEIGLGSIWVGTYPIDAFLDYYRSNFDIPDHVVPFALLGFGYKAEDKEPRDYYDVDRVHYGQW